VSAVDWSRWRKCPVCFAEIGGACLARSGRGTDAERQILVPHTSRKPRVKNLRPIGGAK
jgi:hypothetical protein